MTDQPETQVEPLSPIELRVLGSLVEKQATTPEAYPLTLNALVSACNQKTSREPVLNLEPGQVGQALRRLESRGMVKLVMGARADRWEQRLDRALELIPAQLALLSLLILRGPQTVGELLTRSERLHRFEDSEQVRYQLGRLISRELIVLLPRQPGQREERYLHLLGGPMDVQALAAEPASAFNTESALLTRVEQLEARMAELEARLAKLE